MSDSSAPWQNGDLVAQRGRRDEVKLSGGLDADDLAIAPRPDLETCRPVIRAPFGWA